MPDEVALEIKDLSVSYGKRVAVDHLTLTVAGGEMVAMLGPNGAGKSTTLLAAAGAILPSGGSVVVSGASMRGDPLVARSRVGFAGQPPALYEFFTVAEHLAFVAETRGHLDREAQLALLDELGLAATAHRLCRELSFGMRQRVGLAAALVGEPKVVLLDETLNGLDPRAAVRARTVLQSVAKRGVAVVMSTHLLGVAERLCQRIVVVDAGHVTADVSGDELETLVNQGPGAIEEFYLASARDESETVSR